MALIDKASLLMVPSTYEAGTLYNVLPSGNRAPDSTDQNSGYDQTRADFTFDRGSNAAATRVNADGLIEKYRENLLLQSNQFDTTWAKSNATLTSGQADKDGGTDAWKLEATATLANLTQSVSSSGVNTFSVYAKAGTEDGIFLRVDGGSNPRCFYNLKDGVVGNPSGSPIETSMEDVGGGWYRCNLVVNSAVTAAKIYVANDSNGFVSSGSIYIQNAQLETGMVSTDYLDSGATTAKAGVLIDLPRINYDSNGENGALLLEPSRVNKIQYANYFKSWAKTSASVTTNAVTSPDGLKNASKLVEASGDSFHFILSTPTIASGAATFSFYAKSAERTSVSAFLTQSGNNGANFDLSAETATAQGTGNTATIESVGDGWYRCVVINSGSAQIASQVRIGVQNGALDSYVGDGTSGVYLYGAQLEAGSYATSYIPNHGTSGGVTRAADSCSVTGVSDVIGQSEGVVYFELDYHDNDETAQIFEIHGTAGTTRIFLQSSSSNQLRAAVIATNGYDFTTGSDYLVNGNTYKIAFAYKSGDYALYVNGSSVNTSAGAYISNETISVARFAQTSGGFNREKIQAKNLTLFNERLSNAELAALTA